MDECIKTARFTHRTLLTFSLFLLLYAFGAQHLAHVEERLRTVYDSIQRLADDCPHASDCTLHELFALVPNDSVTAHCVASVMSIQSALYRQPRLSSAFQWSEIAHKEPAHALDYIGRRIASTSLDLRFLGTTVSPVVVALMSPLALVVLLMHFSLYLNRLRKTDLSSEDLSAWFVLFPGRAPGIIAYATLGLPALVFMLPPMGLFQLQVTLDLPIGWFIVGMVLINIPYSFVVVELAFLRHSLRSLQRKDKSLDS